VVTRSGVVVAVASLLTIGIARALGLPELAVVGTVGLALVLVALVQVRRPLDRLVVTRRVHPERVPRGSTSRVELQITNRGRRRSPVCSLHDPVEGTVGARVTLAPLAAGGHHAASYRLPTERRGLVHVGPLETHLADAFGLARRRHRTAPEAVLTVLPEIEALTGVAGGGGPDDPLAGLAHPVLGASGDEDFAALRPYVVGDDLRRVHWASSARAGDLVVRQDDPPWQGHVTVLVDGRIDRIGPEAFERAVSAAASVVHAVARKGDRVRLVMTDGTDTGLVDARAARATLLEHLALVERHQAADLPEIPVDGRSRTGALVVVSGPVPPTELEVIRARRGRFAAVRLVVVEPSVDGDPAADLPSAGAGIDLVRIDPATSFPAAWAAAGRRTPGP
jgi:uncharacterized protein (DUF58 family)